MGSRVSRMFRNFNLENRAHREISKAKPLVAPRHPTTKDIVDPSNETPEATEAIHKKNDPLLSLLKSVYVESKDPPEQAVKLVVLLVIRTEANFCPMFVLGSTEQSLPRGVAEMKPKEERRALKVSLPGVPYGIADITDVPAGKLSIVEALKVLNNYKHSPKTWTPEKIAQEYTLDLKDTKALLEFFVPFDVKIIPPKD